MRDKVLRWCRENAMLSPGQTVVCAVSGGADSVAMLHILCSLRGSTRRDGIRRALQPPAARRGIRPGRSLCPEALRLLGRAAGRRLWRRCRPRKGNRRIFGRGRAEFALRFFRLPRQTVATAHTADDNLETMLLNFLARHGLTELGGIPPKRDFLVRPILCCTRQEVLAYLDALRLPHVEDSTNAADDCVRNRLRHNVLPLLKAENPALAETALRTAQLLRQDDAFLDCLAEAALQTASAGTMAWRCDALRAEPGRRPHPRRPGQCANHPHPQALARAHRSSRPAAVHRRSVRPRLPPQQLGSAAGI